jgi:hypothetical protein
LNEFAPPRQLNRWVAILSFGGTTMETVIRKTREPFLIARVAEFTTKIPLNEWPTCSVHGKTVDIHEEDIEPSHGVPNFTVAFYGCCDNALDTFYLFMDETLGLFPQSTQ